MRLWVRTALTIMSLFLLPSLVLAEEPNPAVFDPDSSPYDDIVTPEKVYAVYDQITVEVNERTSGVNNTTLRTQKETTYQSTLNAFLGLDNGNLESQALNAKLADMENQKEQNSRGQQSVTRQITSQFTARVVDILPNGLLVLEAQRHRRLDFEEETLILYGVVDPEHIDKDKDLVKSDRLADLDLQIIPSGTIADAQERGFISWLWDKIWPF